MNVTQEYAELYQAAAVLCEKAAPIIAAFQQDTKTYVTVEQVDAALEALAGMKRLLNLRLHER